MSRYRFHDAFLKAGIVLTSDSISTTYYWGKASSNIFCSFIIFLRFLLSIIYNNGYFGYSNGFLAMFIILAMDSKIAGLSTGLIPFTKKSAYGAYIVCWIHVFQIVSIPIPFNNKIFNSCTVILSSKTHYLHIIFFYKLRNLVIIQP